MLTLGLFLSTLDSFHIAGASGAPLAAIGAILLAICCRKLRMPNHIDIVLFLIFMVGAFFGIYRASTTYIAEVKITNLIGWSIAGAVLLVDFEPYLDRIALAIRNTLLIHICFFLTQVLIYIVFAYYIDFCIYPFDCTMRYYEDFSFAHFSSPIGIRPTGLFEEPSNYATFVLGLALLWYLQTRRVSLIVLLALLTAFLTFSSWSFGAIVFCVLFFSNTVKKWVLALMAIGTLYLLYFDWFWARTFVETYETGQTPFISRTDVATWIIEQIGEAPWGTGIGVINRTLPNYILSLYDSGAALYFVYVFGVFGFMIAGLLLFSVNGLRRRLLMLFFLASKCSPVYPFFWIMVNLLRTTTTNESEVGSQRNASGMGDVPMAIGKWGGRHRSP